MCRQLFKVASENAPSIVFIDEIDAIGTKRYESTSGGEREVQRTMLELLNQLDGFDDRGDVKVIMATNKIESLDRSSLKFLCLEVKPFFGTELFNSILTLINLSMIIFGSDSKFNSIK